MSEENNNASQSEWRQRELGAFWKREHRNGSGTFLAGHIVLSDEFGSEKKVKVVLFSNKDKPSENAPDFKLYRSKEYNQEGTPQETAKETEPAGATTTSSDDEEIL